MNKIDTTSWRQFCIEDLFDVVKGKRLTKADRIEGDINYIGASIFDNGITAKIGNREYVHPAGTITVCYNCSDIGTAFYQDEPFWATDDVNVLYPKFKISPNIAHFLCPIIHRAGQKYTYEDKWTAEKMRRTIIVLPSKNEEPDWQYMEEYMRHIEQHVWSSISALKNTKEARLKIDHSYWQMFELKRLFEIVLSKGDIQAKKMKEGEIPLVSSGKFNNGICKYIAEGDGKAEIVDANIITTDMFGKSYYQPKPFYAVSHGRINMLIPRFKLNNYIAIFIVSILDASFLTKYSFSGMCNQTQLRSEKILLPATPAGEPDWHYMEMYMRGVEAIVKNKLSLLVPHKTDVSIKNAASVTFNNANVTYIDQSKTYNVK